MVGYSKYIRKRSLIETLDTYTASSFPNMEQAKREQRVNSIVAEIRELEGLPEIKPELDRSGLHRLKSALASESRSRISVK